MFREPFTLKSGRLALLLLAVGAALAGLAATRSGSPGLTAAPNEPVGPPVVLTGTYNCDVFTYPILTLPFPPPIPAPSPEPRPEPPAEETDPTGHAEPPPEAARELLHWLSITGTGGITPVAALGPGFGGITPATALGPGFGGQGQFGRFVPSLPVNLGSGVSGGFDGGTLDDCLRFGETLATVARRLGCATSPVRARRQPLSPEGSRFSFVCEGPASDQVHAIGELDRAVLALQPAAGG